MSAVEYNSLIFEISQKLDELNVGRKLIVMCRGKLAPRGDENMQDAFSLFVELEEKEFLGPDHLDVLKDLLKGVKEWALLEEVEKFESKRKDFDELLEQIIRALDELNDVERLVSICREKIPQDRQGNIRDVRSLFKELENNNCLEINRLGIVKKILAQTEKKDLLMAIKEFDERRTREDKFERRKARAAAIVSAAKDNLSGVLNVKTVFKGIAGGIVIASAFELLRRGSTYDQLVTAINTCVLPAGVKLIQIVEGSVNLKVQAENRLALDNLWRMYKNGTLKARLEALFVTDEMKELAGGKGVEVIVSIDEQEYEKAQDELTTEARDDPIETEEKRLKYLDQEKYDYIQNYLEQATEQTKDVDSQSVMTETSDSGMLGSNSASSEIGTEQTSDSTSKLCLKDVSEQVAKDLTSRLKSDPVALERFYRSFGLDPVKLRTKELWDIKEFFPDTPVKTLKDVFEALQLYDLVELLDKITKPRALRPALPLKEIEKLPSANNRPTKIYTKAEVLIISCSGRELADSKKTGSFFEALSTQNQVTTLTAKFTGELCEELDKLRDSEMRKGHDIVTAERREARLKRSLEKKIPVSWYDQREEWMTLSGEQLNPETNEHLMSMFYKEEVEMKKELRELVEKIEQSTKKRIPIIEKIKQKEDELKKENEQFRITVSTQIDKWIERAQEKDDESTLFVVLVANRFEFKFTSDDFRKCLTTIKECLKEKLPLIPHTKLVVYDTLTRKMKDEEIPPETLQVYLPKHIGMGAMLELLNKRYKSLDLIAVMFELKRTFSLHKHRDRYAGIRGDDDLWFYIPFEEVEVYENLSCLPRLHKLEQV